MKTEDQDKLRELLRSFATAMLVTKGEHERLRARPMALAGVEDSGRIWFISGQDTAKVHEIERDTHVHLVLQKEHSIYLSINGIATLVHDREKVAELWKEPFRVWFPGGKDDANIVLISVEPQDAEYWDSHGWNKISYVVRAARAYVTGKPPKTEEGKEHGTLGAW